jgi:hypothetical protein
MRRRTAVSFIALVLGTATTAAFTVVAPALAATTPAPAAAKTTVQHVLLISVDGMHASDLAWYVRTHPTSKGFARLAAAGRSYTNARTPVPSDSFPGLIAQLTGGNPGTTGIWYDQVYDRSLLPPGTTSCAGTVPGTVIFYDESNDLDSTRLDAGEGLAGLPGSILGMTGQPQNLLVPDTFPVDPATCAPVAPHSYLRVNTVFDVARAKGLRTAWSDKHPAYELVNGPSGDGVQDLFTPEINSLPDPSLPFETDWTKDNANTRIYDGFKVQAVLNEIDGYDHSRTSAVGVPAIFGLNLQAVSTAQKLDTSNGLTGGYLADGVTPGPLLSSALDFADAQVAAMLGEIAAKGLTGSTAVILSARHGQSPQDPGSLIKIDGDTILSALDDAWNAKTGKGPLVTFSVDDTAMILWLNDRSDNALTFAKKFLLGYKGDGTTGDGQAGAFGIDGAARAYTASGLKKVLTGEGIRELTRARSSDPRVPDLIGVTQHGVVYALGSKIAEHGGADPQDRSVALVVMTPGETKPGKTVSRAVQITQVAPTILELLGLPVRSLDAVKIEGTESLRDS